MAFGMQSAKVDGDGKLWFVGAFEETNPLQAAGRLKGKYDYSMGLGCYDPFKK
jgi:streptogramin lyase